MSREEHAVDIGGFWIFCLLSVLLAVLKLTVVAYWSWWRVALPLLAFLGHNALYILTAFICFHWLKDDQEESTSVDEHSRYGTTQRRCYLFFFSWTTSCDVRRGKLGVVSGHAPADSR
jgi:uncharacterized membrane protein